MIKSEGASGLAFNQDRRLRADGVSSARERRSARTGFLSAQNRKLAISISWT